MEGPARSVAQMWMCGSFCTCCQWESAKFVPIDNSSPPSIRSSDLQLHSKHSQDHGNPEVNTVEPEPSSLRSAFGPTGNWFSAICHHHSLTEDLHLRRKPEKTWRSQKSTGVQLQPRAWIGLRWAAQAQPQMIRNCLKSFLDVSPRFVQLVLTKLNS